MQKIIRGLLIVVFISLVAFSPVAIISCFKNIKSLYLADSFTKMKVWVDSTHIEAPLYSDGTTGSPIYHFYTHDPETKLSINTYEKALLNRALMENPVLKVRSYMEGHNDSIWIWYHPKAAPKYAQVEESDYPTSDYIWGLATNLLIVTLAVYAITWQINYNRKEKKTQEM